MNGNHEVKIISWLVAMGTVDWMMWKKIMGQVNYFVSVWMIGMYPAFVQYPVPGSPVGSSHVKVSVSLSRCSMSRLW
jgi:hypothetical protein